MQMEESRAAGGLVDAVADWLVIEALAETTVEALISGCCARLNAAGIPLWRMSLAFSTLHPLFAAVTNTWVRNDDDLDVTQHRHGVADTSEQWQRSPFFHIIKTSIPFLRRRLTGPEALLDFPILPELRDRGATDYLAYAVQFGSRETQRARMGGIIVSWTTDRPGGFTDNDIQALMRIQRRLALACKVTISEQITRDVLATYLGPDAGRRVLGGNIQLGDGETTHAVIWFSDLRNSTGMADTLPPDEFLATVNAYFDCTAGAVLIKGGEVLRFVGDAVLAIFPIPEGGKKAAVQRACRKALRASGEARCRLRDLNEVRKSQGKLPLNFGIGLHIGDVHFGNIGVPERLEFSVVGPAANEAARLESLAKTLDRPVLVSGEFAASLDVAWESMGAHKLRGVDDPLDVFAPPDPVTR